MKISIEKAKEAFETYVSDYDLEDGKIKLKLEHTYYVMDMSEYIARKLELSEEDIQLARLIGLLHDIGRFEQLRLHNSFDDRLYPHAQAGVHLLFEEGMIRKFIESPDYDEIIKKAIFWHASYQIEEELGERELLHAKIIRDADKLDNFRVKVEEPIETILDISPQELGASVISDKVYETVFLHKTILKADRKSPVDMWISYIAFVFDLNFKPCYQYLMDTKYIERNVDHIVYTNPDTARKMDEIKHEMIAYCIEKVK